MTHLAPNPYSPYADADPRYRHVFPVGFLGDPAPDILFATDCQRLAVVPETPLQDANAGDGTLPDGLCPACVAAMRGQELPADGRPVADCADCGDSTDHDGLCAMCRLEAHEEWWPHRGQDASEEAMAQLLGPSLAAQLTTDMHRAEARMAYDLIAAREGADTARAWLIGKNPDLDDQAPLTAIVNGWRHDVLAAARGITEADTEAGADAETDQPTGEKYPCAIGVFCDKCRDTFQGDFIVSDDMDRQARFEVARKHLRENEGWSCTEAGDFCPKCQPAATPAEASGR